MNCLPMIKDYRNVNSICESASPEQFFAELMACASQNPESIWLAQIIASWQAGKGVLPNYLGLQPLQFSTLIQTYFPGYQIQHIAVSEIRLDFSRMLEKQDLEQFLHKFVAEPNELHESIVSMIVAACLGEDHLWQDLGLWSRQDLSNMLSRYFPELKQLNHRDMKWKKFLYKQLCEMEGIYVCRAPSCDVCKDYQICFGPED